LDQESRQDFNMIESLKDKQVDSKKIESKEIDSKLYSSISL
jgi:hypothetical protein